MLWAFEFGVAMVNGWLGVEAISSLVLLCTLSLIIGGGGFMDGVENTG